MTDRAGIGRTDGHGFGAVAADLNGDGRVDLYAVNDLRPNFLFLNKGDGTFEDVTETSGAAFDAEGGPQASMGVDAEDCDGDGRPELLATNYQYEYTAYYQNLPVSASTPPRAGRPRRSPSATHRRRSAWSPTASPTSAGAAPWPTSTTTAGPTSSSPTATSTATARSCRRRSPISSRRCCTATSPPTTAPGAGRRFERATLGVGPYFDARHAGRGAAFGDLDDDGDIDIVVNHRDDAPAVLRNDTPGDHNWIRLKLVGTRSNRDAIGARVEVQAGGRTITRQRKSGHSLESANDPRLLIGLGAVEEVARVTIRWPSGIVSTLEHLAPDTTYEVVEPRRGRQGGGGRPPGGETGDGLSRVISPSSIVDHGDPGPDASPAMQCGGSDGGPSRAVALGSYSPAAPAGSSWPSGRSSRWSRSAS